MRSRATSASSSTTTTGSGSATTCRCSSTCSRRASTSARSTTAPAACPRVVAELIAMGKIDQTAITVNGKSLYENNEGRFTNDREVIKAHDAPMKAHAGFLNLKGNLFDSAIMKTSVISDEFRERYLANPLDPERVRGPRDRLRRPGGLPRAHRRPGARARRGHRARHPRRRADRLSRARPRSSTCAPPDYLLKRGIHELPCIGDGRQSGTSGSPSILNASPEAATGGGLALLQTGDRVRIDLGKRTRRHPRLRRGARARGATRSRRRAATRIRRARRRGRRSSAASSTSCRTAWC